MNRARVLLLNDTSEVSHWGCTATSTALLQQLAGRALAVDRVHAREIPRLGAAIRGAGDLDRQQPLALLRHLRPALWPRFERVDRVIVNGEGSLHGDRDIARTLLYMMVAAAQQLHKPVDLVNHSCYPQEWQLGCPDRDLLAVYRRAYSALRSVTVREPVSRALVARELRADAVESFDCLPLYVADHAPDLHRTPRVDAITLSGSVVWQRRWARPLIDLLLRLRAEGLETRLLVGAHGGDWNREDRALVADLTRAWRWRAPRMARLGQPAPWRVVDAANVPEWLDTIASSRLLISGRFHHSIAAACAGTPALVAPSNTPKNDGMRAALGDDAITAFGVAAQGRDPWPAIRAKLAARPAGARDIQARRSRLCAAAQINLSGLD